MAWVVEHSLRDRVVAAQYALTGTGEVELEGVAHGRGECVRYKFEWVVGVVICISDDFNDGAGGQVGKGDSGQKWKFGDHLKSTLCM